MNLSRPFTNAMPPAAARAIACSFWTAALAGCAGTGSHPAAPPNLPTIAYTARQALPSKNVLYVSDPILSRVDIYPLNTNNPAPIGEITSGIYSPTGMAESSQELYVANNSRPINADFTKGIPESVTVYAPGSGSPDMTYSQDLLTPTDVVVGRDGIVYVAGYGDGYVTEYPQGSKTPSLHFRPPSGSPVAVALDAHNNLYVACALTNTVFKFSPGSTQGTNLLLALNGEPHGMAFDSRGNLLIADSSAPNSGSAVEVFPPGKKKPSKRIGGVFQPFMIALDRSERHLYVADIASGNHDGAVFEFSYPSGTLVGKYSQGAASAAYGVAVNPTAP
jgi:hypothetical protein